MRRRSLIVGSPAVGALLLALAEPARAQGLPPLSSGQAAGPKRRGPPRIGEVLEATRWRAESLRGQRVIGEVTLTLEFLADGYARGDGGCNRFVGPYATRAGRVVIGPLSSTRRACVEPGLNRQETFYLETLERTVRGQLREKEQVLLLFSSLSDKPSSFLRQP